MGRKQDGGRGIKHMNRHIGNKPPKSGDDFLKASELVYGKGSVTVSGGQMCRDAVELQGKPADAFQDAISLGGKCSQTAHAGIDLKMNLRMWQDFWNGLGHQPGFLKGGNCGNESMPNDLRVLCGKCGTEQENGLGFLRGAELKRLPERGHCKNLHPLPKCLGNFIESMSVAIRLNDGHDLCGTGQFANLFKIMSERGVIDFYPGSFGKGGGNRGSSARHMHTMTQSGFLEKLLIQFPQGYPFLPFISAGNIDKVSR